MDKKIAVIFPGQGAQYVGMGKDFYETFSTAKETFEEANQVLDFSLSDLCFNGPSEELTLTKNSQVAIYVMSIALWRVFKEQCPEIVSAVMAGLSLGEYTALTASGRLSFSEGIALVRARGLAMHESGERHPGTMAVCLGLEVAAVNEAIGSIDGVWVANLNCPGQVVISGSREGIEKSKTLLKEKGAKRVLPLDVSGAFHSGLMEEAQSALKEKINQIKLTPSQTALVMNVSGGYVTEEEIRECMVSQVVSPVQWEKGIRAMQEKGVSLFIEIGCGKTLAGMNRKIGIQGETLSLEKVEDLEKLGELTPLAKR
ncbi:MAG: ACP S-malonyltransferase [Chlamydiia bacterium]|nr:ACP S-malonyltransferase [Chlamydiia bacterium]